MEHKVLQILRHDNHSIDCKELFVASVDRNFQELKLYVFLPHSFGLLNHNRSEIAQDIDSRLRITTLKDEEASSIRIQKGLAEIEFLVQAQSNDPNLQARYFDQLIYQVRSVGSAIGERINLLRDEALFMVAKLDGQTNISPSVEADYINRFRSVDGTLDKIFQLCQFCGPHSQQILRDFYEFIHFRMLEYIKVLTDISEQFNFVHLKDRVGITKEKLAAKLVIPSDSEQHRENLLSRLGQYKKFFQSETFFAVDHEDISRKFAEPIAIVGALMAAAGVAMIEIMNSARGQLSVQGATIITAGVFLYVMKDRLKDFFRNRISGLLSRVFPHYYRNLKFRNKKLGQMFEWIHLHPKTNLKKDLVEFRNQQSLTSFENHLFEDILAYRSLFFLETEESESGGSAIQRTIRMNFSRYLSHLDDVEKNILLLDSNHQLTRKAAHKVYHIHIVAEIRSGFQQFMSSWFPVLSRGHSLFMQKRYLYRIFLDKNGIIKVEQIS